MKEVQLLIFVKPGIRIPVSELPTALAVGNIEYLSIIGFSQIIYPCPPNPGFTINPSYSSWNVFSKHQFWLKA